jgi:hypothetical protein
MQLPPPPEELSPAPLTFAEHLYGITHRLVDRDGPVIRVNLPRGNGPLIERAHWLRRSTNR